MSTVENHLGKGFHLKNYLDQVGMWAHRDCLIVNWYGKTLHGCEWHHSIGTGEEWRTLARQVSRAQEEASEDTVSSLLALGCAYDVTCFHLASSSLML